MKTQVNTKPQLQRHPSRASLCLRSIPIALVGGIACVSVTACEDGDGGDIEVEVDDEELASVELANPPADGEIKVYRTKLADIEVPRGPRLVFIDLADADEPPAVGVYEFVPTGHAGTIDFAELLDATPLEMFYAATTEGTEVPPRLVEFALQSGDPALESVPTQRGWMLEASQQAIVPRGICTDSEFKAQVESYGYDETFRLNQNPATSSFFVPQEFHYIQKNTVVFANSYSVGGDIGSNWFNIDAYYTRVAVCALGSHPNSCGSGGCVTHPGPNVVFQYRNANNEPFGYATAWSHDFSNTGYGHWHWQSGSNWDWTTRIDIAQGGDIFDIGHAIHID